MIKFNIENVLTRFLAVLAFGTLAACGSGGGSSSPSGTGRFVDGPVIGLDYVAGATSGKTGSDSSFTYTSTSLVKFYVGDVYLGQAPTGELVTPLHLSPGSDATTPHVLNVARFLLSIGTVDPVTKSITIPASVSAAAKGKSANLATISEADLAQLVKTVTQNPAMPLVDAGTAAAHLNECFFQEYQGLYKGSFTNAPPNWVLKITINADGTFHLQNEQNGEASDGTMKSVTHLDTTASGGCHLVGTLDPLTGTISGTWTGPTGSNTGGMFKVKR